MFIPRDAENHLTWLLENSCYEKSVQVERGTMNFLTKYSSPLNIFLTVVGVLRRRDLISCRGRTRLQVTTRYISGYAPFSQK